MTPDVAVVIVAGGRGKRVGGAELKQFRWVAGKPMLLHSVQKFQARKDVCMVVVVLPYEHVGDPPAWLFQCDTERMLLSVGGKERGDSVRNGLEDVPTDANIVLIHDAARPFVTTAMIDGVVAEARLGHGAAPGIPVTDTLKRVNGASEIVETVDRASLVRIQTPQGFPREMIEAAHARAVEERVSATDDAALLELFGMKVVVVPGNERAMKITDESDFVRAEALSILPE